MDEDWSDFAGAAPVFSSAPPLQVAAAVVPPSTSPPPAPPPQSVPQPTPAAAPTLKPDASNQPHPTHSTPPALSKPPQSATAPLTDPDDFDDFSQPQSLESIAAYLAGASAKQSPPISTQIQHPPPNPQVSVAVPSASLDTSVGSLKNFSSSGSFTASPQLSNISPARSTQSPHPDDQFGAFSAPISSSPAPKAVGHVAGKADGLGESLGRASPAPLTAPVPAGSVAVPSSSSPVAAVQLEKNVAIDDEDEFGAFTASPLVLSTKSPAPEPPPIVSPPVLSPPPSSSSPAATFTPIAASDDRSAAVAAHAASSPAHTNGKIDGEHSFGAFAAPQGSPLPAPIPKEAATKPQPSAEFDFGDFAGAALPGEATKSKAAADLANIEATTSSAITATPAVMGEKSPHVNSTPPPPSLVHTAAVAVADDDFGDFASASPSVSKSLDLSHGTAVSPAPIEKNSPAVATSDTHAAAPKDDFGDFAAPQSASPSNSPVASDSRQSPAPSTASPPTAVVPSIAAAPSDMDFGDFSAAATPTPPPPTASIKPPASSPPPNDSPAIAAPATIDAPPPQQSSPDSHVAVAPSPAVKPAAQQDANDFGDFAAPTLDKPPLVSTTSNGSTESPSPLTKTAPVNDDDFGDFAAPQSSSPAPTPAAPPAKPPSTEGGDDFGDFAAPQSAPLAAVPAPTSAVPKQPSSTEADDDFGDFAAPTSNAAPVKPSPIPVTAAPPKQPPVDEANDDFGDFAAPSAAVPSAATEKTPATTIKDDDDDFGDFAAPKAVASKPSPAASNKKDDDDDFGDFSSSAAAPAKPPSKKDEADDDFGDFASTTPLKPPPVSSKKDDFGAFASPAKQTTTNTTTAATTVATASADTPLWRWPQSELASVARSVFACTHPALQEARASGLPVRLRELLTRREGKEQFWTTNRCAKCGGQLQTAAQVCLFCGQSVLGIARPEVAFAGSAAHKRFIEALRIPEPPPPKQPPVETPKPIAEQPKPLLSAAAVASVAARSTGVAGERRDSVPSASGAPNNTSRAAASASKPRTGTATTPTSAEQLMAMGWTKEQAVAALAAADGNVNAAIDILTTQATPKAPLSTAKPSASASKPAATGANKPSDNKKPAAATTTTTPATAAATTKTASDDPFGNFFASPTAPTAKAAAAKTPAAPSSSPSSSSPFDLDFLMTGPAKPAAPSSAATASAFDDFLQFDMKAPAPQTKTKSTQSIIDELLSHMPDYSYMLARPT